MDRRSYIPNTPEDFCSHAGGTLPPFPLHIDIEVTSRCNLNCTFCDKQPLLKPGQLGDLSDELFYQMAEECGRYHLESLGLSYRGEPLLHRSIADYVRYAKRVGIGYVSFCTNGMLLTPAASEKLICAGTDEITVSAQGHDAASFESSRLGSNFSAVLRNIREFTRLRAQSSADSPRLRVQAVGTPELDAERFTEFWADQCDEVIILPYRQHLPEGETRLPVPGWCCSQPWHRLTVEWDGTILPCNNDDVRQYALGNAADTSLAEAWRGSVAARLRRMQQEGRCREIADCIACAFRLVAETGQVSPA